MMISNVYSLLIICIASAATSLSAFTISPSSMKLISIRQQQTCTSTTGTTRVYATAAAVPSMADSGVPSTTSEPSSTVTTEINIPTNLPSSVGKDYIPLATMLATGQLAEADQFTRDALIEISGAKGKGRNFVYFTDVKNIPSVDLGTIERLWNSFSNGKFGYSIQKKKWKQCNNDFELFCKKIGWTTTDGELERKKRWFGASEFTYDVKKAPEGHLPLTSALRGTSLLKNLLSHPVWDNDDWKKEP